MSARPTDTDDNRLMPSMVLALCVAAAIAVCAMDARSVWIDELSTWTLTQADSWPEWFRRFIVYPNSDSQLPIYHAYMHAWVSVFGDRELAMRLSNLPWLVVMICGVGRLTADRGLRSWIYVVTAISAFVWYYLNDARPYIIYIAGASWATAAMIRWCGRDFTRETADVGLREFLLGGSLLIVSNVIGAFWVASCIGTMALLYTPRCVEILRSALRQKLATLAAVVVCSTALGLAVHSQLTGVGKPSLFAQFSFSAMGYGLLELLGAAGLGPSRSDLRIGWTAASKLELLSMGFTGLLAAVAVCSSFRRIVTTRQRVALLAAGLMPLLILVAMGIILHWRVVGRHMSALWPLIVIGTAVFCRQSFGDTSRVWTRVPAAILLVCLLVSALSVRWAERHVKDDYRTAAGWAEAALGRGESVLWIALPEGLAYYGLGLDLRDRATTDNPLLISYTNFPKRSAQIPFPDVVILSPREGNDPHRLARPVLESGQYEKRAEASSFELYVRVKNAARTLAPTR